MDGVQDDKVRLVFRRDLEAGLTFGRVEDFKARTYQGLPKQTAIACGLMDQQDAGRGPGCEFLDHGEG
jgi:hypothetical protein